jgi:hypothetical protein
MHRKFAMILEISLSALNTAHEERLASCSAAAITSATLLDLGYANAVALDCMLRTHCSLL